MHLEQLTLTALLLMVTQESLALRCGNRIVEVGDHQSKVFKLCGKPDWIHSRQYDQIASLGSEHYHRHEVTHRVEISQEIVEETRIDEWFYDFGSNRLERRLTFENQILDKIETF